MHMKSGWKKALLAVTALLLIFSLSACSSVEQKREKFMAQGKASYEKGDYITARLHFKNALQLDPELAVGYFWLGKTELHLSNPRGAFGALSKAVQLNPDLYEAQILLGNLFLLGRKLDDAEAKANLVLAKEPTNIEALLLSASVNMAREHPEKALELVEKVRSLDPHKVEAYLMQSAIEFSQKKPDAAAATLNEGIKANPKAMALYLAQARLAERQNQFDQAQTFLKKAEENSPKDIKVSYKQAARAKKFSRYQFRAPGEWFAEAYAAYYEPTTDPAQKGASLAARDPKSKAFFDAVVETASPDGDKGPEKGADGKTKKGNK